MHGIASDFTPWGNVSNADKYDFCVTWGIKPQQAVRTLKEKKVPFLVMERGYLPDRFKFSSLGWGGLNNRAMFPECQDSGERFARYWPDLLKPWKEGGDYVLLCGQCPGDASIYGLNLDKWSQEITDILIEKGERVIFRPHPLVRRRGRIHNPRGAVLSKNEDFQADLAFAKYCVTYNSNAGVESVCAGVPTITLDQGAMAWPVSTHDFNVPTIKPDRTAWVRQLAWCNWTIEEIASGIAWETIKRVAEEMIWQVM